MNTSRVSVNRTAALKVLEWGGGCLILRLAEKHKSEGVGVWSIVFNMGHIYLH